LKDQVWWIDNVGPKMNLFSNNSTISSIFDTLWKDCSELILNSTNQRENNRFSINDINLLLASTLVMGMVPQPSIEDYFKHDSFGIFGNLWMQQHFTKHIWCDLHTSVHINHNELLTLIKFNCQQSWNLHQQLVVDEMIVPFTGKWKHRQYVKGKPYDTGK